MSRLDPEEALIMKLYDWIICRACLPTEGAERYDYSSLPPQAGGHSIAFDCDFFLKKLVSGHPLHSTVTYIYQHIQFRLQLSLLTCWNHYIIKFHSKYTQDQLLHLWVICSSILSHCDCIMLFLQYKGTHHLNADKNSVENPLYGFLSLL